MQTSGVANTPQSQSSGGSSQGLLGFLEAFIQQMHASAQGGGAVQAAQNAPQSLNIMAEKIAALLKKEGISSSDLQNMSPQDLAAQISTLLQQGNIKLPPSLQNMSPGDLSTQLASLIQQNGGSASSASNIKPSLTSDLVSPQSANIQDTQTKEDIAKKVSADLQQDQQQGVAVNPAQLHQLKTDFAQLQAAPGTVDPATMNQLTTDVSSFLSSQGVSQTNIASFLADLTQTLQQKNQTAATPDASGAAASTAAGAAIQPQQQTQQTGANSFSSSSAPSQISAAAAQAPETSENFLPKNFMPQADKTQPLGGKEAPLGTETTPAQLSNTVTQQQAQSSLPQPGNLTAKIAGFSVNPALINDLASGSDSSGSGFSGGFNDQGNNAQQAQDLTGTAALLQPMTADMLQNQNFTNYLNTASSSQAGQPSPTTQQVTVQIQNNINSGVNTMMLQLEPAELGKMNVKLTFTKDGTVKAHMTVDKPETLALLQKDSSHLQRALQQSGLTTDENSLSFDLRQQGQQHNMQGFSGNGGDNADEFNSHMDGNVGNALQAQLAIQSSCYITQSGVNIMV